ncbi:DUF2637 domain-containing protein [Spirillospora sp. NBC_00431]
MNRTTRIAHLISVALMAAGVLAATAVGFAQSWAGLYGWAIEHGLTGWKAASFPAMVDVFIGVGELGLFALALEGHRLSRRALSWADLVLPGTIATVGWSVSLAFNVGHVDHEIADQLTAAVPPIASMLGLLVLLRTLHRLVTRMPDGEPLNMRPLPYLDGRADEGQEDEGQEDADAPAPEPPPGAPVLAAVPDVPAHETAPEGAPGVPSAVPADVLAAARKEFAAELAAGKVPGLRPIKARLHVGQPRAGEVQAYLTELVAR